MRLNQIKASLAVVAVLALCWLVLKRNEVLGPRLPVSTSIQGAFTARDGVAEATKIAQIWAADASLDCIRIAYAERDERLAIDREGLCQPPNGWVYRFGSPSHAKSLWVTIRPDGTCATKTTWPSRPRNHPLPPETLDSPAALHIAESSFGRAFRGESGEIRQMYAQMTTSPTLRWGSTRDPVEGRAIWQVEYIVYFKRDGAIFREDLDLNLDAVTGEVLVAMSSADGNVRRLLDRFAQPPR